jgi:hypothetical protein
MDLTLFELHFHDGPNFSAGDAVLGGEDTAEPADSTDSDPADDGTAGAAKAAAVGLGLLGLLVVVALAYKRLAGEVPDDLAALDESVGEEAGED